MSSSTDTHITLVLPIQDILLSSKIFATLLCFKTEYITAYKLLNIINIVDTISNDFYTARNTLLKKYGTESDATVNVYTFTKDVNKKQYNKCISVLLKKTITITIDPLDIADMSGFRISGAKLKSIFWAFTSL